MSVKLSDLSPEERTRLKYLLTAAVRAQETLWNALSAIETIIGADLDEGSQTVKDLATTTADRSLTPTDYVASDSDLEALLC